MRIETDWWGRALRAKGKDPLRTRVGLARGYACDRTQDATGVMGSFGGGRLRVATEIGGPVHSIRADHAQLCDLLLSPLLEVAGPLWRDGLRTAEAKGLNGKDPKTRKTELNQGKAQTARFDPSHGSTLPYVASYKFFTKAA